MPNKGRYLRRLGKIGEGDWGRSMVVLIYKKKDPKDLGHYRPISLLSETFKLFMRIKTNRLESKFELYQPKEHVGSGNNTVQLNIYTQ